MWEIWRSTIGKTSKVREKIRNSPQYLALSRDASARFNLEGETEKPSGPPGQPPIGVAPEAQTTHVYFKDLKLSVDAEILEQIEEALDETQPHRLPSVRVNKRLIEKHKLILILVGLPGRGKTFLCNKLKCYLSWLGHETRHFNVGQYRRKERHEGEIQDAAFFDHKNREGMEARHRALENALDDMCNWLNSEDSQIAIFDATNTTKERRDYLIRHFHGHFSYMFIESICNDSRVLEENYRYKMRYSPDYTGVDEEKALLDFRERIRNYELVYEPIEDRNLHYIKLIDMVTGRGHMDVNRISGYIPGKIVFFLMQVCKSGLCRPRKIWLTRHGESEYNKAEKIGGDSNLSMIGEEYAKLLAENIVDLVPVDIEGHVMPVSVWTSTLQRTIQTAEGLPFPKLRWKVLDEINAGSCDGLTYEEIDELFPDEFAARKRDKLRYRYPRGESYLDVIQRLEPCIIEVERERECVCIVAHQAVLRALYGYFMAKPLKEIPTLEIPLHTIIQMTPMADGTMHEERIPLDPEKSLFEGGGVRLKSRDPSRSHLADHLRQSPTPPTSTSGHGGPSPSSSSHPSPLPAPPLPHPHGKPPLPPSAHATSSGGSSSHAAAMNHEARLVSSEFTSSPRGASPTSGEAASASWTTLPPPTGVEGTSGGGSTNDSSSRPSSMHPSPIKSPPLGHSTPPLSYSLPGSRPRSATAIMIPTEAVDAAVSGMLSPISNQLHGEEEEGEEVEGVSLGSPSKVEWGSGSRGE